MAEVEIEAMEDVSAWEGISFWARRGPDSQAGFRVLVGDKYTDDDIAYLMYRIDPRMPRYCERVRECGCLNHRPCVAVHLEKDYTGRGGSAGAMGGTGGGGAGGTAGGAGAGATAGAGGTGGTEGRIAMINSALIPDACKPDDQHTAGVDVMKFCGTPEVISGAESATQGGSACNTCEETKCDERWPAYPDDHATTDAMADPRLPVRHRSPVLRQALLALHDAQRHLRLLVLRSQRSRRSGGRRRRPSSAATTGRAS